MNPYLDEHLKRDLGPNYTRDFLTKQLGYRKITGAGEDYYFHPTVADPLNRYEDFQRTVRKQLSRTRFDRRSRRDDIIDKDAPSSPDQVRAGGPDPEGAVDILFALVVSQRGL